MVIKYIKICDSKAFQDIPKLGILVWNIPSGNPGHSQAQTRPIFYEDVKLRKSFPQIWKNTITWPVVTRFFCLGKFFITYRGSRPNLLATGFHGKSHVLKKGLGSILVAFSQTYLVTLIIHTYDALRERERERERDWLKSGRCLPRPGDYFCYGNRVYHHNK
jgi:hypothetical protein